MVQVREALPALHLPSLRRKGCTKPGVSRLVGWQDLDGEILGVRVTGSVGALTVEGVLPPWTGWVETVPWSWSQSPYGQRKWLTCPSCTGRVATLYVRRGPRLECGTCTGLPTLLSTLSRVERLSEHRRRARLAVGLPAVGAGGHPIRPKGCRTDRWLALLDRWHDAEMAVIADVGERTDRDARRRRRAARSR